MWRALVRFWGITSLLQSPQNIKYPILHMGPRSRSHCVHCSLVLTSVELCRCTTVSCTLLKKLTPLFSGKLSKICLENKSLLHILRISFLRHRRTFAQTAAWWGPHLYVQPEQPPCHAAPSCSSPLGLNAPPSTNNRPLLLTASTEDGGGGRFAPPSGALYNIHHIQGLRGGPLRRPAAPHRPNCDAKWANCH